MFSVVIPTYNRADFLRRTIESVLVQKLDDFELIVVDDGSTDRTKDVIRAISDPRVSYHYKINEERAAARNMGTRLSRGRYINFLDSDDLLYENHLSVASEFLEARGEPEFIHLGYEMRNSVTNETSRKNDLPPTANGVLLQGNHFSCNGVFLRRDIAENHPFNQDRALSGTEDYELWLRLAGRYQLHCDNRITSVILEHEGRSVMERDRRKLEKRIELLEKYLFEDAEFVKSFEKDIPAFKAGNRIYIALHLALNTKRRGAIEYLIKAIACSPKSLTARAFYGTLKRLLFKVR